MNLLAPRKVKCIHWVLLCLLIITLVYTPIISAQNTNHELTEGQYPLSIMKQVITMTSDWAVIQWIQGPIVIVRDKILEGQDAQDLDYSVSGLTVWISQNPSDTTTIVLEVEALVLEGDDRAVLEIDKGQIGYVEIEVSVYEPSINTFRVLQTLLIEDSVGPSTYDFTLSPVYTHPSSIANVEKAIKEQDKNVFAFYYQWYYSSEGPSGELYHWDEGYLNSPLMGFYDAADEHVIRAHMIMAKYAGIDCLIIDGHAQFDHLRPVILRLAEEQGLKISMYVADDFEYCVSTYASHPAWLKDDGKPVFFFFSVEDSTYEPNVWLEWREQMETAYGDMIFIGGTTNETWLGVFDGFHVYIHPPAPEDPDLKKYRSLNMERFMIGPHKTNVSDIFDLAFSGDIVELDIKSFPITIIPGYDESNVIPPRPNPAVIEREDGELYGALWETARSLDAEFVLIMSWNEWHEGSEIEPSSEHRFDYLELTKQHVEDYKGLSLPTPDTQYSTTVRPFRADRDIFDLHTRGDGEIVIQTGETPALYVTISM